MRASQGFISTLKEVPHDAEVTSHQLMLRAGLIRKLGSGLYTWLPMGLKVLRRVEHIIREEMDRSGALEILMPSVQPAELWEETGRWETFGGQLLTMKDSNDRAYCFGPTHEEVVTDLMRQELKSYKQLPINVYQIQTKFRDEIRPRFGVMRAREFIMKDAYSFHLDSICLQRTYDIMVATYARILDRLGLTYRAVEADTGAIGGAVSHEFQVLAEAGEDLIFYSNASDYAANVEQATSLTPTATEHDPSLLMSRVETPTQKSILDVANHLNLTADQILKTLVVEGTEHPFIALVLRGDDSLNDIKALKHPWIKHPLRFADHDAFERLHGFPMGFIGPIGLNIPTLVDYNARAVTSFVCGANEAGYHLANVVWGRDTPLPETYDLRQVRVGDKSPDGQGTLQSCRGIEVGHVFQLGARYAAAMNANVINEAGQAQTLLMGCYGLGVSRIVAAAIEQHHDDKGIRWPSSLAPFQFCIIPINAQRSEQVKTTAEALYQKLLSNGMDVLLDDRAERPGVLFADHDLIGIPHRIVISDRLLADGVIEYKARNQETAQLIPQAELNAFIQRLVTDKI
jgi:prolyl-tRNA synthetase